MFFALARKSSLSYQHERYGSLCRGSAPAFPTKYFHWSIIAQECFDDHMKLTISPYTVHADRSDHPTPKVLSDIVYMDDSRNSIKQVLVREIRDLCYVQRKFRDNDHLYLDDLQDINVRSVTIDPDYEIGSLIFPKGHYRFCAYIIIDLPVEIQVEAGDIKIENFVF